MPIIATQHCVMGVEDLLDLARKELLAAAIDDLLAAPRDLDVARGRPRAAEVAGPEPAFAVEGLCIGVRIVVIAEMDRRAARHQFADLA